MGNVDNLRVYYGSKDRTSGGESQPIMAYAIHPSYNNTNFNFDLAIIRVSNAINVNRANVGVVRLPTAAAANNAAVTISGWLGADSPGKAPVESPIAA